MPVTLVLDNFSIKLRHWPSILRLLYPSDMSSLMTKTRYCPKLSFACIFSKAWSSMYLILDKDNSILLVSPVKRLGLFIGFSLFKPQSSMRTAVVSTRYSESNKPHYPTISSQFQDTSFLIWVNITASYTIYLKVLPSLPSIIFLKHDSQKDTFKA